jgi:hypothetical protein
VSVHGAFTKRSIVAFITGSVASALACSRGRSGVVLRRRPFY